MTRSVLAPTSLREERGAKSLTAGYLGRLYRHSDAAGDRVETGSSERPHDMPGDAHRDKDAIDDDVNRPWIEGLNNSDRCALRIGGSARRECRLSRNEVDIELTLDERKRIDGEHDDDGQHRNAERELDGRLAVIRFAQRPLG